jgi:transcriptional regulator with XRE-family HTH domain
VELAARAHTSRIVVWRVESGISVPTLQVLRDVAHAFGMTLSALLDGVDRQRIDHDTSHFRASAANLEARQ